MSELPFVTIILPVYNEEKFIEKCIHAVQEQDYPPEKMEILVADGMSTDKTVSLLNAMQAADKRISVFSNPGKIVPTGLNILIPEAKGDVVVRIDGHCIPEKDYVSNCVRHIQEDGVVAVGGPMKTIQMDDKYECIALATSSKFGVGNSTFRTMDGLTKFVDTVPFPAYSKVLIEDVGLYDEELVRNQDDEYNYRCREKGYKILLANDVRSVYFARSSFKKLWKQYFQYGYWKVRVLQKHPKQMSLRQFVPPAFVLAILFFSLLAILFSWGWIALLAFLGLYFGVNLAVSLSISSKKGWQLFPGLVLSFLKLHIAYGTGFITGLFKFWNRWNDRDQGKNFKS